MLRLMKTNAVYFIQHSLGIMTLMTLYWFLVRKELSGAMVLFQGLWLILSVEGALAMNEKIEEKSEGYKFLRCLPIKDREVILSKFVLVLLTTALLVAYNYIIYLFFPGPAYLYAIGRVFVLLCALFAIVLAAVSYTIIFRFGHAVFVKFVWVVMIITMVSPILIFEFVILKMDMEINEIMERLGQLHWLTWIIMPICGFAIFYLLYQTATQAKEASRG
jgi:ABC-type transport system involved in multi-copper enzyme maturation permease subunit